jgi:hypothetical protein
MQRASLKQKARLFELHDKGAIYTDEAKFKLEQVNAQTEADLFEVRRHAGLAQQAEDLQIQSA